MDRQEILLKEYEACQTHNNSIGSQVWVSTTIFLSINITLLGWLLHSIITKDAFGMSIVTSMTDLGNIIEPNILGTKIATTAIGIGIICILRFWKRWLKRMRFQTTVNFDRMGTIERKLRICRHTISRRLDKTFKHEEHCTPEQKRRFEGKRKFWNYFPASGFDGLIRIASILIGLWVSGIVYIWFTI